MKNNSLSVHDLKIGIKTFLSKDRGVRPVIVINGLNVTLNAGELLLIQGASGSGKSMLLKAIAGLATPISGEIHINDRLITSYRSNPAVYIGQPTRLRNYRSLAHNIRCWARASGNPELYEAAMQYFELEPFATIGLRKLSDGYRQRALLSRLITMPSALWLLDDPFVHLDYTGAALLSALIQTRLEQHGIILLATHQNFSGERVRTLNLSEQAISESMPH